MSIDIVPNNEKAGIYGMPNGFWPALCVETPVSKILGCSYKEGSDKSIIKYDHDGFVGKEINQEIALKMYAVLESYVDTPEFKNHRYFKTRSNQMFQILEFLPVCGGFRAIH